MGFKVISNWKFSIIGRPHLVITLVMAFGLAHGQSFTQKALDIINTEDDEQAPLITPDGKTLYYTVSGHSGNVAGKKDLGDIWYSTWTGDHWGPGVHAGAVINDPGYNCVIGFSHDGNRMFLGNAYHSTAQGFSISHRKADGWSTPEFIKIPYFHNRSTYTFAYFSTTVEAVVFSCEGFSGHGSEDIFVARLVDGQWTEPVNLGAGINTHLQEWAPSLSADGKILYFSSNGYKGYGSFDVYFAERLDETWTKWTRPVNMGANVNTEGRELHYRTVPASKLALFTSTHNSDGHGDIRVFAPPPNIHDSLTLLPKDTIATKLVEIVRDKPVTVDEKLFTVFGKVTNSKTGKAILATIEFKSDTMFTVSSKGDGKYTVSFPTVSEYAVSVEAPGYIGNFEKLDVRTYEMNSLELNFKLQPIEVGATVNLKSVLFKQGTSELLPESDDELDEVVEFLKINPKVEIELGGHTDNRGVHEHNVNLSKKRVETVKAYLVSKGIRGGRIDGKGYGGSKPIADNRNEETRRLNRRVEFTIVKN